MCIWYGGGEAGFNVWNAVLWSVRGHTLCTQASGPVIELVLQAVGAPLVPLLPPLDGDRRLRLRSTTKEPSKAKFKCYFWPFQLHKLESS